MGAYFNQADVGSTLPERIAIIDAKAEMNRAAMQFFNGFERINLAKWRRRIDRATARKN